MPDLELTRERIDPGDAALLLPALLRQVTAGIAVLDDRLVVRLANARLGSVLGLPAKPEAGPPLAALLAPCAGPALDAALAPFRRPGGGDHALDLPRRTAAGGDGRAAGRRSGSRPLARHDAAAGSRGQPGRGPVRASHLLRHVTDCIVLLDADGVILENSDLPAGCWTCRRNWCGPAAPTRRSSATCTGAGITASTCRRMSSSRSAGRGSWRRVS